MTTALTDFDSMFGIFILYFGEIKEQERINRRGKKLKHFYADAVMHVDSRYWRIFRDGKMLFGKYDYIDTDVWGKVFALIKEIIALKPMLIKIEMSVLGDCILYFIEQYNLLSEQVFSSIDELLDYKIENHKMYDIITVIEPFFRTF